ncbi:hypothetical protein FTUN_7880 [Frigoriglobus tundricola]|uniref:Uncharacterized protein n=1 Tax=Frigoriglobus tundricola TaxID=2774151 RepID=A0A6M5Z2F7_9BACT|nr:hypothetical protein FTUN_7880 [Frigoriglobus tundricola]
MGLNKVVTMGTFLRTAGRRVRFSCRIPPTGLKAKGVYPAHSRRAMSADEQRGRNVSIC